MSNPVVEIVDGIKSDLDALDEELLNTHARVFQSIDPDNGLRLHREFIATPTGQTRLGLIRSIKNKVEGRPPAVRPDVDVQQQIIRAKASFDWMRRSGIESKLIEKLPTFETVSTMDEVAAALNDTTDILATLLCASANSCAALASINDAMGSMLRVVMQMLLQGLELRVRDKSSSFRRLMANASGWAKVYGRMNPTDDDAKLVDACTFIGVLETVKRYRRLMSASFGRPDYKAAQADAVQGMSELIFVIDPDDEIEALEIDSGSVATAGSMNIYVHELLAHRLSVAIANQNLARVKLDNLRGMMATADAIGKAVVDDFDSVISALTRPEDTAHRFVITVSNAISVMTNTVIEQHILIDTAVATARAQRESFITNFGFLLDHAKMYIKKGIDGELADRIVDMIDAIINDHDEESELFSYVDLERAQLGARGLYAKLNDLVIAIPPSRNNHFTLVRGALDVNRHTRMQNRFSVGVVESLTAHINRKISDVTLRIRNAEESRAVQLQRMAYERIGSAVGLITSRVLAEYLFATNCLLSLVTNTADRGQAEVVIQWPRDVATPHGWTPASASASWAIAKNGITDAAKTISEFFGSFNGAGDASGQLRPQASLLDFISELCRRELPPGRDVLNAAGDGRPNRTRRRHRRVQGDGPTLESVIERAFGAVSGRIGSGASTSYLQHFISPGVIQNMETTLRNVVAVIGGTGSDAEDSQLLLLPDLVNAVATIVMGQITRSRDSPELRFHTSTLLNLAESGSIVMTPDDPQSIIAYHFVRVCSLASGSAAGIRIMCDLPFGTASAGVVPQESVRRAAMRLLSRPPSFVQPMDEKRDDDDDDDDYRRPDTGHGEPRDDPGSGIRKPVVQAPAAMTPPPVRHRTRSPSPAAPTPPAAARAVLSPSKLARTPPSPAASAMLSPPWLRKTQSPPMVPRGDVTPAVTRTATIVSLSDDESTLDVTPAVTRTATIVSLSADESTLDVTPAVTRTVTFAPLSDDTLTAETRPNQFSELFDAPAIARAALSAANRPSPTEENEASNDEASDGGPSDDEADGDADDDYDDDDDDATAAATSASTGAEILQDPAVAALERLAISEWMGGKKQLDFEAIRNQRRDQMADKADDIPGYATLVLDCDIPRISAFAKNHGVSVLWSAVAKRDFVLQPLKTVGDVVSFLFVITELTRLFIIGDAPDYGNRGARDELAARVASADAPTFMSMMRAHKWVVALSNGDDFIDVIGTIKGYTDAAKDAMANADDAEDPMADAYSHIFENALSRIPEDVTTLVADMDTDALVQSLIHLTDLSALGRERDSTGNVGGMLWSVMMKLICRDDRVVNVKCRHDWLFSVTRAIAPEFLFGLVGTPNYDTDDNDQSPDRDLFPPLEHVYSPIRDRGVDDKRTAHGFAIPIPRKGAGVSSQTISRANAARARELNVQIGIRDTLNIALTNRDAWNRYWAHALDWMYRTGNQYHSDRNDDARAIDNKIVWQMATSAKAVYRDRLRESVNGPFMQVTGVSAQDAEAAIREHMTRRRDDADSTAKKLENPFDTLEAATLYIADADLVEREDLTRYGSTCANDSEIPAMTAEWVMIIKRATAGMKANDVVINHDALAQSVSATLDSLSVQNVDLAQRRDTQALTAHLCVVALRVSLYAEQEAKAVRLLTDDLYELRHEFVNCTMTVEYPLTKDDVNLFAHLLACIDTAVFNLLRWSILPFVEGSTDAENNKTISARIQPVNQRNAIIAHLCVAANVAIDLVYFRSFVSQRVAKAGQLIARAVDVSIRASRVTAKNPVQAAMSGDTADTSKANESQVQLALAEATADILRRAMTPDATVQCTFPGFSINDDAAETTVVDLFGGATIVRFLDADDKFDHDLDASVDLALHKTVAGLFARTQEMRSSIAHLHTRRTVAEQKAADRASRQARKRRSKDASDHTSARIGSMSAGSRPVNQPLVVTQLHRGHACEPRLRADDTVSLALLIRKCKAEMDDIDLLCGSRVSPGESFLDYASLDPPQATAQLASARATLITIHSYAEQSGSFSLRTTTATYPLLTGPMEGPVFGENVTDADWKTDERIDPVKVCSALLPWLRLMKERVSRCCLTASAALDSYVFQVGGSPSDSAVSLRRSVQEMRDNHRARLMASIEANTGYVARLSELAKQLRPDPSGGGGGAASTASGGAVLHSEALLTGVMHALTDINAHYHLLLTPVGASAVTNALHYVRGIKQDGFAGATLVDCVCSRDFSDRFAWLVGCFVMRTGAPVLAQSQADGTTKQSTFGATASAIEKISHQGAAGITRLGVVIPEEFMVDRSVRPGTSDGAKKHYFVRRKSFGK